MQVSIIDDDPISIFLTESMISFQNDKIEIKSFSSVVEALNTLTASNNKYTPNIILLDLEMPALTGWDFLEEFTPYSQNFTQNGSIYILTSSIDPSDKDKIKAYPFVSGLIQKPIKMEDINLILSKYN